MVAKVVQFPTYLTAAPRCAQCQTKMTLNRVEPNPKLPNKETHVYVCDVCGLIDIVQCDRE